MVIQLNLSSCTITQVAFGYQTVLLFHPEASVAIEGAFRWTTGIEGESPVFVSKPEEAHLVASEMTKLLGVAVSRGEITSNGDLVIEFETGAELHVDVESSYEAYDLNLNGSPKKIVGGAGSRIDIFD